MYYIFYESNLENFDMIRFDHPSDVCKFIAGKLDELGSPYGGGDFHVIHGHELDFSVNRTSEIVLNEKRIN